MKGEKPVIKTGGKLRIDPEVISKLGSGDSCFCFAVHGDGSENRINGEAIVEATVLEPSLGIVTAVFQGIRKAFRNRGKTKEDLAAEKEAAKINKTCGALNLQLLDYIRAAQEGGIEEDDLDTLIDTFRETEEYSRSGKLKVTDEKNLAALCKSIVSYTAAVTGGPAADDQDAEMPVADMFCLIREQLTRQKKWISEKTEI